MSLVIIINIIIQLLIPNIYCNIITICINALHKKKLYLQKITIKTNIKIKIPEIALPFENAWVVGSDCHWGNQIEEKCQGEESDKRDRKSVV